MNEPFFDAFLEEVVGGVQPPDVTDKVLAKLLTERRRDGETERKAEALYAPAPRPVLVQSSQAAVAVDGSVAPPLRSCLLNDRPALVQTNVPRHRSTWLPLALAASLLLAVGAYWLMHRSPQVAPVIAERTQPRASAPLVPTRQGIAQQETTQIGPVEPPSKTTVALSPHGVDRSAGGDAPSESTPGAHVAANNSGPPESPGNAPMNTIAKEKDRGAQESDRPASAEFDPSTSGDSVAAASLENTLLENTLSASATSDAQVIAYVNAALEGRWKESGVRPSPAATESEWCRRVFLDLIGRIPTVDELEAFLIDNRRDKRARLVYRLLDDDRYIESYARFWTTLWTNLLIGRTGGMEPNSPVYREGLQQYLRRSFLANKPYNRLVYELISAEGANRPLEVAYNDVAYNDVAYNGAVNFLLAQMQEKAAPATAKTAQVFLGLQLQCTQCHHHPFNEWKQNRFWELNSFFRQMHAERAMEGNQLKAVRLIDADFSGEGGDPREAEVYFELRNGILQVAYPKFIDGTAIDPSGLVSVVDRRQELARMVSRSEELKLAIVNRTWAHFFGYGFTKPVDDMGPHNPPSHPELLARLAEELAGHGYDLKRLMRWTVLNDAYALSSKFGPKLGNALDDPTSGNTPLFSHFYVRQMSPEQLYDSLLVATGALSTEGNYEQRQRAKDRWLEQFAIAFGTDENDEATTFDGTITQTLVMMNGELTRKATTGESGNFLAQVSMKPERAAALNELYLAALARRPSRQEVHLANSLLTAQSGNVTTALEDIWWALLNSNEFILNH